MFKGSLVAIVTPFRNGRLDEEAFSRLIEWQIAEGVHGIVPCGTTGESATLSHEEHHRVVELTVKVVNRRVPVVAGTGSNSTVAVNSVAKFPVDMAKQFVAVNHDGYVIGDNILFHLEEDR